MALLREPWIVCAERVAELLALSNDPGGGLAVLSVKSATSGIWILRADQVLTAFPLGVLLRQPIKQGRALRVDRWGVPHETLDAENLCLQHGQCRRRLRTGLL